MTSGLLGGLVWVVLGLALVLTGSWWLVLLGVLFLVLGIRSSLSAWRQQGHGGRDRPRQPPPRFAEPGHCAVLLADSGPRRVETIKVIREVADVGLAQAKDWVDDAPCLIAAGLSRDSADRIVALLERAGAAASVQDSSVP